MPNQDTRDPPVYETPWYGRVSAAVWERTGESATFYSVTLREHFRDAGDSNRWKSSRSINADQLGNVHPAAADAQQWVARKQQAAAQQRHQR